MTTTTVARRAPTWRTIALLGTVPIIVGLLRLLADTNVLDGDEGIFAGQVADAATGGFPTVGLYSRFRWNHPGPIGFYLFAPFHWLSGGAAWGMVLGAAVWNSGATALAAWLAARRGGRSLVMVAVALSGATWIAIGGAASLDPWTPNLAAILVPPLLFAAWGAAVGDATSWAWLAVVSSVAVQLHVGYGIVVSMVVAAAVAACFTRTRLVGSPTLLRNRVIHLGIAAAALTWVPVVADALTGRTGNIGKLWRYFRRSDPPDVGLPGGARIVARETALFPSWITGPRTTGLFAEAASSSWWWLAVPVGAMVAARAVARRNADEPGGRAVLVAAVGFAAAVVAAGQVRGIRFDYLFYWRTPIVLFVAVATAFALRTRIPARARTFGAALLLAASVLGATAAIAGADEVTRHGRDVEALIDTVAAVPDGPVLVRLADSGFVGVGPGVLRWLEQNGVRSGVDESVGWVFGDRTLAAGDAEVVWYVADTGWGLSLVSDLPGARVVAERSPLAAADEERVRELHRELAAQLTAAGFVDDVVSLDSTLVELALQEVPGIDLAALAELAEWNEQVGAPGARLGIVAFDPADAPVLPWRLAGF